jgi:hypothetical protein
VSEEPAAACAVNPKSVAAGTLITVVALVIAWLASPVAPTAWTSGPTVTAHGRITLIDLNGKAFTILGANGTQEFHVTSDTVIRIGTAHRIAFVDLARFLGANCTVLSADTGEYQDASRIELFLEPASAPTQEDHARSNGSAGTVNRGSR